MLTEADKNRITEEEIYRQEVKRDIEIAKPAPSNEQRLWDFLNKPFILWFLSTLLVGLATTTYSYFQNKRSEQAQKQEIQRKLDIEIASRIRSALDVLQNIENQLRNGGVGDMAVNPSRSALDGLDGRWVSPIFTENKDRTFRSLIFELSSVVPDNQKPELQKVSDSYMRLRDFAERNPYSGPYGIVKFSQEELDVKLKPVAEAKNEIINNLLAPRWKTEIK